MHKFINTNTDIIKVRCNNPSCTGNIYNKLPNTKHTQGAHCVKFTNVSRIT